MSEVQIQLKAEQALCQHTTSRTLPGLLCFVRFVRFVCVGPVGPVGRVGRVRVVLYHVARSGDLPNIPKPSRSG